MTIRGSRKWGGAAPLAPFLVLLLAATFPVEICVASTEDANQPPAKEELLQVFLALQQAESRGANVTSASHLLNQALALIQLGDEGSLEEASSIIASVNSTIPLLAAEGEQGRLASSVGLYSFLAVLSAIGALSYLYLPKMIWRSWAKARGDWEVASS